MARFFNTAGPCDPRLHYMLPPERRIPGVRRLLAEQAYFVVRAPRQTGKTTAFRKLAGELAGEGVFAAVHLSCEAAAIARNDVGSGVDTLISILSREAEALAPELRSPDPAEVAEVPALDRLTEYLSRWSRRSPLPIVLFLDEIDALQGDTLLSVLRQLRAGYPHRPAGFPHSVALIGLRDVRDYRAGLDGETLGTSSPFNIKVESLTLPSFEPAEIAELYDQHQADTGQAFTTEAKVLAFELTAGQPWLVNALARQAVQAGEGKTEIGSQEIESAKEALILRRDTHLDSLIDRLREPRVRRILEPILAGELLSAEVLDDDIAFVRDLGLVEDRGQGLEIANPIYREVIPRALTSVMEHSVVPPRLSYVAENGGLDFDRLLTDFEAFWLENSESFLHLAPYSEAAAQLVFMAFLQKITNGKGRVDREYAVGRGRLDLCVRWPRPDGIDERFAVELKVWRDGRPDPEAKGIEQLTSYLERLGLDRGTLVLFDQRSRAPAGPDRRYRSQTANAGRRIDIVRL
jgi:hypothetical protein